MLFKNDQRLAPARKLLTAGRLDEAEALLAPLQQRASTDPEILCAFAALLLARRQTDRAFALLSQGASLFPNHFGVLSDLGTTHLQAGRIDEAGHCFARAAALAPDEAGPRLSMALVRVHQGRPEEARAAIAPVLARDPDHTDALSALGTVAMAERKFVEAEALLRRALLRKPDDGSLLHRLAACLQSQGRAAEATALIWQAHVQAPLDLSRQELLAQCQASTGDLMEAQATVSQILAVMPANAKMRELQARLDIAGGRADKAVAAMTAPLRARPTDPPAALALARTLRLAGRRKEALAVLTHAIRGAEPTSEVAVARRDLALALGQFQDVPEPTDDALPNAVVTDNSLSVQEQVLAARFLVLLAARRPSLVVHGNIASAPWLDHLKVPIRITAAPPPADAITLARLMSLFGHSVGVRTPSIPYLAPSYEARERWQQALDDFGPIRIGCLFEDGALGLSAVHMRKMVAGLGTAVSLVAGPARHQLRHWPDAIDAGRHITNFDDLLGAVAGVDIIVGTDSAALQMAGALGKPAILLGPPDMHWSWADLNGASIWYPTVTVVRSARPGTWDDAVAQATEYLEAALTPRRA